MNPFERFESLRPDIEEDEVTMRNLRTYAFTDRVRLIGEGLLECAGTGVCNTHFRIGRIGDLWLTTREYFYCYQDQPPDEPREVAEMYIRHLIKAHEEGRRVPILCGGVISRNRRGRERCFLVLEDLTAGGTSDFRPGQRGDVAGTIDGREVYHDFEDQFMEHGDKYRYMTGERAILLAEPKRSYKSVPHPSGVSRTARS